ncbi:ComEC/Rec2 family competence protein [Demequina sp. SO4-13]|uniref:ComEC/Rec2 family competence protein n=1 Tax=Demequina sp. SO4-13 TaxID=3401027 RepID=UPI003AF81B3A
MSTVHDARLVPAALAAWAAALVLTTGWAPPPWFVIALVAVTVTMAVVAVRSRSRTAALSALLGTVVLAVGLVATAEGHRAAIGGTELVTAAETDAWIEVTGQVAPMRGWNGEQRHRVAASVAAWRPQCREPPACAAWIAADAPVVVSLDSPTSRGERLLVEARWTASDRGPGAAIAWDARQVAAAPPTALVTWRERFTRATASLGDESRGLVRGMVVGDTSTMSASQVEDMRVAGLAHLTAVSGAHFAILIMACSAGLSALRAPRTARAAAILVVAATFAALVGPESSVLRALGMAVAVALATGWGRPARGLAALATSVIVLLILEPQLSRSLGFGMSVVAVAAIVLWAPRVAGVLAHAVTPTLARVAAIPIAAQAAVTPMLLVIEPRLGPYAVLANLVAGLAVLPTMLTGAATLVLAVFSIDAATLMASVAGASASVIAAVARAASSAPGSWLPWAPGPLGVSLAIALTALLIIATTADHVGRRAAAVVGACALIGVGLGVPRQAERPVMEGWEIAMCDVGQGDMILLRAASDAAVVIDTGPPGGGAAACLSRHGVARVPLLVLTHPHQDHDGAVVSVLSQARVEAAWVSAAGAQGPAARVLGDAGAQVEVPPSGRRAVLGAVALTVLSTAHERAQAESNDASVVVQGVAGHTSVLALGDLETRGQRELLDTLKGGASVDVVKVAHHGSADQVPELAAVIDAPVALVSAGRDNPHGHPTAAALALYGAHAHAVLRTDTCGDIQVATVAGALAWSTCPTDVAR